MQPILLEDYAEVMLEDEPDLLAELGEPQLLGQGEVGRDVAQQKRVSKKANRIQLLLHRFITR